jgi:hypothetical protein
VEWSPSYLYPIWFIFFLFGNIFLFEAWFRTTLASFHRKKSRQKSTSLLHTLYPRECHSGRFFPLANWIRKRETWRQKRCFYFYFSRTVDIARASSSIPVQTTWLTVQEYQNS